MRSGARSEKCLVMIGAVGGERKGSHPRLDNRTTAAIALMRRRNTLPPIGGHHQRGGLAIADPKDALLLVVHHEGEDRYGPAIEGPRSSR